MLLQLLLFGRVQSGEAEVHEVVDLAAEEEGEQLEQQMLDGGDEIAVVKVVKAPAAAAAEGGDSLAGRQPVVKVEKGA